MTHPARDISDWLIAEARSLDLAAIVDSLGHRLTAAGVPLHRMTVSFGLLNPSVLAAGMVWRPGLPMSFTRYNYSDRDDGSYNQSPFKVAHGENRWVELDLPSTPDDMFGIIPELKEQNLAHYIVIPMQDSSDRRLSLTVATRDRFTEAQKGLFADILPALAAVVEIKTLRGIMNDVLAAYVGRSPARQILSGTIHRGEVTVVKAAIWVADLRGFTEMSTRLAPLYTAEVINRYYDIVVPAIEAHGGEVLKFIGDAVLAIFPVETLGHDGAALAALSASRAARAQMQPPSEIGGERVAIRFGIAIHFGEAVYGNVGSGDRLDFTVIGRDVNIAARIASLCSRLGREFLVSAAVAEIGEQHGQRMGDAGAHDVRGLATPLPVFVPDEDLVEPGVDDGVSLGPALVTSAHYTKR